MRILFRSIVFLAAAWALTAPAGSLEIERLVPFASADAVRFDITLKSAEELGAVDLSARITRDKDGSLFWQGPLGRLAVRGNTNATFQHTVTGLKPDLWEPTAPSLYRVKLIAGRGNQVLVEKTIRFGFRSFESRASRFFLNGRAVFLRGIAINPPGRGIPPDVGESRAFAEAYVRFLKSQNVNTIRLTHDSQVWFEVCDELGMLVYQGQYGSPLESQAAKQSPPSDFNRSLAAYQRLFETYASHPSILIYILSNELPASGARGKAFHDFLGRACDALKLWDPTRLYIGNAGYGEGREGDICDVHRYWGWYYNSFLTYYNLRDLRGSPPLFGDLAKNQPLTFTECVGSFTGSLGEFNLVRSKQLGAQLGWTGHSANQREDALRYQAFMVKQATESFRRLRPQSPRLSGIMPFTILFYNWSGISAFEQMKPKPALDQMRISYQPILLSWELWSSHAYAGSTVQSIAHVVNDSDHGLALTNATLHCRLQSMNESAVVYEKTIELPAIPYYESWSKPIQWVLPPDLQTGDYILSGTIRVGAGVLSTNSTELFVAGPDWKTGIRTPSAPLHLYDPDGNTASALGRMGIHFQQISDFNTRSNQLAALIIGEHAWDKALERQKPALRRFIREGGRVLCLRQDPKVFDQDWLPCKVVFFTDSANSPDYPPRTRPFAEQMNVNLERPDHPVFNGLNRARFRLWSDYTGWDQTKPGFPKLYPVTAGFKLASADSLAHAAILADYDRGLEGIALCEMFDGRGSVMLSGFDLVNRAGRDPVADRLLANLVAFVSLPEGHSLHPLIEQPIRWGNYASERGTVCGSLNGLAVNAEWVPPPTDPGAKPLPPNTGSWNMQPGEQFVARGRNPLGPFSYSTGSSLKDANPESDTGSGVFWVSLPPGRKTMVTQVRNPSTSPVWLTIGLNEMSVATPNEVAPGQTIELRSPLPLESTDLAVRYTGTKTLVLLETRFE